MGAYKTQQGAYAPRRVTPDLLDTFRQASANSAQAAPGWEMAIHIAKGLGEWQYWDSSSVRYGASSVGAVASQYAYARRTAWPVGGRIEPLGLDFTTWRLGHLDSRASARGIAIDFSRASARGIAIDFSSAGWRGLAGYRQTDFRSQSSELGALHTQERSARLQALAAWSIAVADLDWSHLDSVDQLGWGEKLEE